MYNLQNSVIYVFLLLEFSEKKKIKNFLNFEFYYEGLGPGQRIPSCFREIRHYFLNNIFFCSQMISKVFVCFLFVFFTRVTLFSISSKMCYFRQRTPGILLWLKATMQHSLLIFTACRTYIYTLFINLIKIFDLMKTLGNVCCCICYQHIIQWEDSLNPNDCLK